MIREHRPYHAATTLSKREEERFRRAVRIMDPRTRSNVIRELINRWTEVVLRAKTPQP